MLVAGVCPVLLSVQVIVAALGVVVGVALVQALRASTVGVLTTKLTAVAAALPLFGVAVNMPL